MTNALPRIRAAFRETKAEGGWGVDLHGRLLGPSQFGRSFALLPFATLWDEDDIRAHALMTDAVHKHGALAGVELLARGRLGADEPYDAACSPLVAFGHAPDGQRIWASCRTSGPGPWIKRRFSPIFCDWQAEGARKAGDAGGFDVVYVYAGMGYLPYEFLLQRLQTSAPT